METKTLAIGLTALVVGCTTPSVRQEYNTKPIHIILDRPSKINQIYENVTGDKSTCGGFSMGRSIYVPCDKWGEPDFYVLGHEVWHQVKGRFHK